MPKLPCAKELLDPAQLAENCSQTLGSPIAAAEQAASRGTEQHAVSSGAFARVAERVAGVRPVEFGRSWHSFCLFRLETGHLTVSCLKALLNALQRSEQLFQAFLAGALNRVTYASGVVELGCKVGDLGAQVLSLRMLDPQRLHHRSVISL
eukprot:5586695-Pleurochrysis_carterae.AAC.2